jgi:hypothetical protein
MRWRRNGNWNVVVWIPADGRSLGPKELGLLFELERGSALLYWKPLPRCSVVDLGSETYFVQLGDLVEAMNDADWFGSRFRTNGADETI